MKKHYLSGLLLFACLSSSYAQVLPDPLPQPPSNSNFYYQNLGQIIDENGNTHPEIRYYTEHAFPAMYLADDKISFVASKPADTSVAGSQDTIGRIDMQFLCNGGHGAKPTAFVPCGVIHAYQPSQDHLNYYLPQTPSGIANVPGYARIVYQDAFPNIDVHFYSNAMAMKVYFVIKPGGNPNDIKLAFTGQDSIGYIAGGSLAMYLRAWKLQFPQAIAYQIDASNNTSVLNWLPTWNHNGSGEVTITTGTYNTSEDLVIGIGAPVQTPTGGGDNLEWATFYGADSWQQASHITANNDGVMYHVLASAGTNFLSQPGEANISPTLNNGALDWYVSKFNQYGVRQWATYYGGSDSEWPTAIKESYPALVTQGAVWVAGYTYSYGIDLGQATGFQQTANAGVPNQYCQDGLLASFDKANGGLIQGTYFGGVGSYEFINDLSIDPVDATLYIVGTTDGNTQFATNCAPQTTGKFPLCPGTGSRFFQGSKANATDREGFVTEFKLNKFGTILTGLNWSTLFGGVGSDDLYSIYKVNNASENALYIGGRTSAVNNSGSYPSPITSHAVNLFPLANPGSPAFFQSSNSSNSNSFLARFNANDQLSWCSFFGSSYGGFKGLAFNSDHKLYALGDGVDITDAAPPSPNPNLLGKIPVYATGSSSAFSSSTCHLLLTRLNPNLSLGWSTFLPGPQDNSASATDFSLGLGVDQHNYIYTATTLTTGPQPVYNAPGAYWQPENASENVSDFQKTDGYILAFDEGEQAYWGTFLGGAYPSTTYNSDMNAYDDITELATGGSYIFFTGTTRCFNSPYTECPSNPPGVYCDQSYNPTVDAFIARFSYVPSTGIDELEIAPDGNMLLYPNPSNGLFTVRYTNELDASHSASMTITDQLGRSISATTLKLKPGDNSFKIDMANLANGIYFLEINNEGQKSVNKFIKQ